MPGINNLSTYGFVDLRLHCAQKPVKTVAKPVKIKGRIKAHQRVDVSHKSIGYARLVANTRFDRANIPISRLPCIIMPANRMRITARYSLANLFEHPIVNRAAHVTDGRTRARCARLPRHSTILFLPIPYGSTNTGRPIQAICEKYSAFQFASRKQPCDSARPTCSGRGVP